MYVANVSSPHTQAICHPLSNCTWTPKRSNMMIGVAWLISLALCVPQAIIFRQGEPDKPTCFGHFPPDWGVQVWVGREAWLPDGTFSNLLARQI